MHARQGFDYDFPDVSDELFLVKQVVEHEDGTPFMAALLRLTSEAYLLFDPKSGTPRDRWAALLRIHENVKCEARQRGLADVHCWLPPEVPKGFDRRLMRLGWVRSDNWRGFVRSTGGAC
jgi:hypothetical protein